MTVNDERRPEGRRPATSSSESVARVADDTDADEMIRLGDSPEFQAELDRLADLAPEPFASQLRAITRTERRAA
jgi:hypothetical protein